MIKTSFLSSITIIFCHIIVFLHWHNKNTGLITILDNINMKFVFNILGKELTYLFSISHGTLPEAKQNHLIAQFEEHRGERNIKQLEAIELIINLTKTKGLVWRKIKYKTKQPKEEQLHSLTDIFKYPQQDLYRRASQSNSSLMWWCSVLEKAALVWCGYLQAADVWIASNTGSNAQAN